MNGLRLAVRDAFSLLPMNRQNTDPAPIPREPDVENRTRAVFPERSLGIAAEHDPELADLFHIRQWTEIAGSRLGLGDFRPQRGGLFGRFEAKVSERA